MEPTAFAFLRKVLSLPVYNTLSEPLVILLQDLKFLLEGRAQNAYFHLL